MKKQTDGGGAGFAMLDLLILLAALGVVAAIPVVATVRARIAANESATIGDIHTVISAQAAYQALNGGWYEGNFACLAQQGGCIPSSLPIVPTFLDSELASLAPRSGYARATPSFGSAPNPSDATLSASSVSSFVYTAVPELPGQTGVRGFGGDPTGFMCYSEDGTRPTNAGGVLTPGTSCLTLR